MLTHGFNQTLSTSLVTRMEEWWCPLADSNNRKAKTRPISMFGFRTVTGSPTHKPSVSNNSRGKASSSPRAPPAPATALAEEGKGSTRVTRPRGGVCWPAAARGRAEATVQGYGGAARSWPAAARGRAEATAQGCCTLAEIRSPRRDPLAPPGSALPPRRDPLAPPGAVRPAELRRSLPAPAFPPRGAARHRRRSGPRFAECPRPRAHPEICVARTGDAHLPAHSPGTQIGCDVCVVCWRLFR